MEQDRQLKEILLNSAKGASPDFTEAVMQKINALSVAPLHYEPLVSSRLKRVFVFTFITVIAAILGLCLMITLTNLRVVSWIENMNFPDLNYNTILMFILSFWFVFTTKLVIEKRVLFRNNSYSKIR